jgi:hypothetical protein
VEAGSSGRLSYGEEATGQKLSYHRGRHPAAAAAWP